MSEHHRAATGKASPDSSTFSRRAFVRTSVVGGAAAALLAAELSPALADSKQSSTATSSPELVDAGAGMHAGPGTLQMMGVATVAADLVSCSVAQMGLDLTQVEALQSAMGSVLGSMLGRGFSGPFAMLMYSLDVTSYDISRSSGVIRAKGTLRSITKVGGSMIEDAKSPYLCVATDGSRSGQPDSFYLSFTTPFWSTSANPIATPSQYVSGWSQFGGNLIVGEVSIASLRKG